ncbi:zinc/manganese transport system substrate-binding protein [Methanomicrobium sp. W14]|uniref:metal ABC transporter substrate-binding protein n=1 Tax=Methanomicrobium sp. W14 TaxID=2817839 RepID=UPI001FD928FD|nr:metal ABC transporter substrate-binding protein [Methanomicrobium sp. W14]MBP2134377.1 zinc/manganese transport system substrate-binding protein [Methanomicrobium sp. W14]
MNKMVNTIAAFFLLMTLFTGVSAINIVSTTTVLSDPLEYIGGDNVNVISLADPAICPHMQSDIIPNRVQMDMDFIESADMFVAHNGSVDSEYTMPYVEKFMDANGFGEINWVTLKDPSAIWDTPVGAKNLSAEVAGWLIDADPVNESYYEKRLEEYLSLIDDADLTPEEREAISGKSAIVMIWQKEAAAEWLGLNLTTIYAPGFYRNGQFTPRAVVNDVYENPDKYRNVDFIIENMQSEEIAKGLEEALIDNGIPVKRVVFTNFPGSVPGVDSLPDVIKYNKMLILSNLSGPQEIKSPKSTPLSFATVISGVIASLCIIAVLRVKRD